MQNEGTKLTQWQTTVSRQNPELLKKAVEELNENPKTRIENIQELRELVFAEEELTSRTDDAFLLRFLRVRKFDVNRAFNLLLDYHRMRTKYATMFASYRPSSILNSLNQNLAIMLPKRDQLGRRVLLIRCGKWDPSKCSADELLLTIHMCVETSLLEEETQIHGIVVIWDFKDFGLSQARHGTPSNARKYTSLFQAQIINHGTFIVKLEHWLQDNVWSIRKTYGCMVIIIPCDKGCLPARFKGFHFIFQPPIFDIFLMVLKPFFSKKTKSRLYCHGSSVESLHEHIEPECLPEEYGGKLTPADNAGELQTQNFLAHDDEIAFTVLNYGFTSKK